MKKLFLLVPIITVILSGCAINSSVMLKTPNNYVYDIPEDTSHTAYRISTNDMLDFRLLTNDGFEIIEQSRGTNSNTQLLNDQNRVQYIVEFDGYVKFPILGRVKIDGLTLREAEYMLEERYVEFYNRPFVQLDVTNQRVIVFPGQGGDARVVQLKNNNITVMEALALAGGISNRGRANHVKLIRAETDADDRKIFFMDLSTIEGIEMANMVIQANDIIYVQPLPNIVREINQEILPMITLITSLLLIYGLVTNL